MVFTNGRKDNEQDVFRRLAATYFSDFSFSFLGTAFILVWIQCILYARYIWVDSGLTTIAINFARCGCIIVLGSLVLRRAFSTRTETTLGWFSILLMTAGSLLFFLQATFPYLSLTWVAAVFSGVGLAWGGGIWMKFYARLGIHEALLCAFLSLALSTIIGIFIGLVNENIAFFISMMLPVMTFVMYGKAMKVLDVRVSVGNVSTPPPDDVYAAEPARTLIRLGVGIALFSFVLGMSRGFPFGTSIELPPLFQIIQHVSVAAAGLGIIWWTLGKGRGFRFSTLWQIQLAALAIGVLLLSTLDSFMSTTGATLIAITNLFQVGFLWFVSYDVARHRAVPPYLVAGVFWFLHLFFRESGRFVMWEIGGSGGAEQMLIIACMICLLAVSVGFLLSDSIPRSRPMFAELCGKCRVKAAYTASTTSSSVNAQGKRDNSTGKSEGISVGETSRQGSDLLSDHADARSEFDAVDSVRQQFGLTNREAEVLALLAEGRSSSYIAKELFLADNTVRSYVKSIYQKIDVHSKQDLIDFMKAR